MTVTLSTETGKIVAEKVNSGAYRSADEVVTSGVRLLDAREKETEALRREIMRGLYDIRDGRFSTLSTDEKVYAFSDDIIRQTKQRRDASRE